MFINESKKEITMTKTEYAKAMRVGTVEFEELFRAKQLYPRAKVVIKKNNNKDNYQKLTKKFMLGYIQTKDNEYYDEFVKLFSLIGTPDFENENGEVKTISFFTVREKFLNRYPQFMTKEDRKKYEDKKKSEESKMSEEPEENTNIVEMSMAG